MQTFDGNLHQPFNKAISYWNPWKTKVFAQYTVFDQYRFAHNTVFAPTRRKVCSVHSVRSKAEGSLSTQCSLQGKRSPVNSIRPVLFREFFHERGLSRWARDRSVEKLASKAPWDYVTLLRKNAEFWRRRQIKPNFQLLPWPLRAWAGVNTLWALEKRSFDWFKHNDFLTPQRKQRRCPRCYAVATWFWAHAGYFKRGRGSTKCPLWKRRARSLFRPPAS